MDGETYEQLRRTKSLLDAGTLSLEEFATIKNEILDSRGRRAALPSLVAGSGGPERAEDAGQGEPAGADPDAKPFWPELRRKISWFLRVEETELFVITFVGCVEASDLSSRRRPHPLAGFSAVPSSPA